MTISFLILQFPAVNYVVFYINDKDNKTVLEIYICNEETKKMKNHIKEMKPSKLVAPCS